MTQQEKKHFWHAWQDWVSYWAGDWCWWAVVKAVSLGWWQFFKQQMLTNSNGAQDIVRHQAWPLLSQSSSSKRRAMVPFMATPSSCLPPLSPSNNTDVTSFCKQMHKRQITLKPWWRYALTWVQSSLGSAAAQQGAMLFTYARQKMSVLNNCQQNFAEGTTLTRSMKPSPEASKKQNVSCAWGTRAQAYINVPCPANACLHTHGSFYWIADLLCWMTWWYLDQDW